jgi:roadblock/LC7 domain-containing protein
MSQQIQDKEFDINELDMQTVKFNKIDKDSQSFHQAFETIRPFKATLATATGILESANTAKEFKARDSKDFRDAMLAPIMKNITEAKAVITAGKFSKDGRVTPIQQTLNMLEDYAKFSEERMATSMKLLEDYAGTGANVEINRLATLPILYLTYLGMFYILKIWKRQLPI